MNFVAIAVEIVHRVPTLPALDVHYGERKGTHCDFSFLYHPIRHSHRHLRLGSRRQDGRNFAFVEKRTGSAEFGASTLDGKRQCAPLFYRFATRRKTQTNGCSCRTVGSSEWPHRAARVYCSLSAVFCLPEGRLSLAQFHTGASFHHSHHSTCPAVPRR